MRRKTSRTSRHTREEHTHLNMFYLRTIHRVNTNLLTDSISRIDVIVATRRGSHACNRRYTFKKKYCCCFLSSYIVPPLENPLEADEVE